MGLLDAFEINCLGLFEEKHLPLGSLQNDRGQYWDQVVSGAFLRTRGESHSPSTPGETNGSTISTIGSPSNAIESEVGRDASNVTLGTPFDCRVESKKAESVARSMLALEKRAARNW